MDFLVGFLLSVILISNGVVVWFLYKLHKRVDGIFTIDTPSPNEATKQNNETVELNEQNVLDIPSDVKFQIEGADENIPPGYKPPKTG